MIRKRDKEIRKNFWPQINADERGLGEEEKSFWPQINANERGLGEEKKSF